jgi:hypothetical protein
MRHKNKPNWREIIKDYNEEALFIGNKKERFLDDAIVGIGCQHGSRMVLIYDYDKLVELFADKFSEDPHIANAYEAAIEWVDHNVACAYVGENTPIIQYVDAKRAVTM